MMSDVRPADGTLKELKSTFKDKGNVLINLVDRMLLKKAGKEDPERDMSYLHPSEMVSTDWCPRASQFRIMGQEETSSGKKKSASLERIYQEGHDIHDKWQEWIAASEGVELLGHWKCRICSQTYVSRELASLDDLTLWNDQYNGYGYNCGYCEGTLKYKEVPLFSGSHMIIGKADGALVIDSTNYLLEIKSIGVGGLKFLAPDIFYALQRKEITIDQVWYRINKPFPVHIRQVMIYIWLIKRMFPDFEVDRALIVYDFKANQQPKEFVVKYNEVYIADIIRDVEDIVSGLDEGYTVEEPEWASVTSELCEECPYYEYCWGVVEDKPSVRVKKTTSKKRKNAL